MRAEVVFVPLADLCFANIHAILTGVGKSWTLFEMFNEFELELLFVTFVTLLAVGMFMFKALPHRLHGLRAARLNSPAISCRRSRLTIKPNLKYKTHSKLI